MQLRKFIFIPLRILSLFLILAALVTTYQEWVNFQQRPGVFPQGSKIAGIPVGGLDRQQAIQRVQQAYSTPVVLHYNQAVIELNPAAAGFQLDLASMLPDGQADPTPAYTWQAFRAYLWDQKPQAVDIPLKYTFSEEKLREYLKNEIAARYDQPPVAPLPIAATVNFKPGKAGYQLDVDEAVHRISKVLPSLDQRQVDLPVQQLPVPHPKLENLGILLKQLINVSGFNDTASLYLRDLQTGQEVHFALLKGTELPIPPDVTFSASSTIKIGILISVFHHLKSAPQGDVDTWLREMISKSSNDAADALMKNVLDQVRGPLVVSEDMRALGLKNTFLAGYFALGSPLLEVFKTPANTRLDVDTDPDPYNQTTTLDLGTLLTDIYQCVENGSGPLVDTFPGAFDQSKCKLMLDYLELDREPYLITAGTPEGTPLAHKHGYGSNKGVINTIGDAALVFSPGGDYVLVVFLNNPDLLVWDPANELVARLARAVYNDFNPPQP